MLWNLCKANMSKLAADLALGEKASPLMSTEDHTSLKYAEVKVGPCIHHFPYSPLY